MQTIRAGLCSAEGFEKTGEEWYTYRLTPETEE